MLQENFGIGNLIALDHWSYTSDAVAGIPDRRIPASEPPDPRRTRPVNVAARAMTHAAKEAPTRGDATEFTARQIRPHT